MMQDNGSFDREKWKTEKQNEKKELSELLELASVEVFSDADKFKNYLNVQSFIDGYSVGNTLLIAKQMPTATKVADFDTWQKQGVSVVKGATGIKIFEAGAKYTKQDGTEGVYYNVKRLFDISQTNAEQVSTQKTFTQKAAKDLMDGSGVRITPSEHGRFANGRFVEYDPMKNAIEFYHGLTPEQYFKEFSREIAYAKLDDGTGFQRSDHELVAESVCYCLSKRYGLKVQEPNFRALLVRAVPDTFHAELNTVKQQLREQIRAIESQNRERSTDEER